MKISKKCIHVISLIYVFTQCVILFLYSPYSVAEQDTVSTPKTRPKICVVLSGGGARGAAHIGVLKVLEEMRVPIDCIAGTSMGSLVGAAYASGLTIPEMEKLVGELSTEKLFKEDPPREEQNARRKEEDYINLVTPEVGGVKSLGGTILPQGFVSGLQLEAVLRDISAPGYLNFDKLPIQYRAVATNLVNGKEVVFKEGELAHVMRASMSVPIAISPSKLKGEILVDGMLVNNLPVSVAKEMGADIIIAVNVGTPLKKREELGSILGVAGQMLSILTEQNVKKSLALLNSSDVVISPELGDFSTSDFDNLTSVIPIGETAARDAVSQLSKLSLSEEKYAQYRIGLNKMVAQDKRPVDEVRFVKLNHVNPEFLKSKMKTKTGKPIDIDELNKDLEKLYGNGDFEHIGYQIFESEGERVLEINAAEKNWGPNYIRLGASLEHDFHGRSFYNLFARHRKTWLNPSGAELLTDLQLGKTDRFRTEFYQPLNDTHSFFVAPLIDLNHTTKDVFNDDKRTARYDIKRYTFGINLGMEIDEYGQIILGARKGTVEPSLDIGSPSLSPSDSYIDEGAFVASIQLDRLDSVAFPTKGWLATGNIYNSNSLLGADNSYTKWDFKTHYFYSFGKNTIGLSAIANGNLSGTTPNYDLNQWGGFLKQSGYQSEQLLAESITFGRLLYYRKFINYKGFDGLYAGFSLELGKARNQATPGNNTGLLTSASAFVATDTPLGPLYLGYGVADGGENSPYVILGLPF